MIFQLVSACYRQKAVKTNDLTIHNSYSLKCSQVLACIPWGLISFVMIEFTTMNYLVQGMLFIIRFGRWVQAIYLSSLRMSVFCRGWL